MQVEKILVLSTCHVSTETAHGFVNKRFDDSLVVVDRKTGWFINVVGVQTDGTGKIDSGCPDDLMTCIRLAQENDCEWLLLDRDGPIEADLPTFDWEMFL